MSSDDIKTQGRTVIIQASSIASLTIVPPKFDDVALPGNLPHSPLTPTKSVSSSPGVIVRNSTVPAVPSIIASPTPAVIRKAPFIPPVINEKAAASFWKSGKGHSFGLANEPPTSCPIRHYCIFAGCTWVMLQRLLPTSTALSVIQPPCVVAAHPKPASTGSTSIFGGSAQGLHSVQYISIPGVRLYEQPAFRTEFISARSSKPTNATDVIWDCFAVADANFRCSFFNRKYLFINLPPFLRASAGSSHVTAAKSAPAQDQIIRQHRKEALWELKQQVAQYVSPARGHQASAVHTSTTSAQHEVECADPMNLIRALLLSGNAAESANSSKPGVFTDRATSNGNGIFKPAPEIIRKSSQEECSK
ncbi:hypothetical protein OESDEN_08516 [Oesophagostomum dentatum]|uniref:Uncharacterized protein n=1 Tax=Oesophagostomum dentatum TaxID=61180 RepID=A0A0B1T260_OESDE|nr:hypothetical protein OESDEN_08516 [Oesophagostomum dentatum]